LLTENCTAIFENKFAVSFFSQIDNQPKMDPQEVVAPAEVCPLNNGVLCPICMFDFEDGERIVVMGCQGRHILHSECYELMVEEDKRHQGETYAHTLFEAVRRHEGANKCPVCRQMSHCAVEAIAMIFYSGKTADDAIVIKDEDDDDMSSDDVGELGEVPHPGYGIWLQQHCHVQENYPWVFEDDISDSDDEEWFDAVEEG
jgi:hypothetical protein